MFSISLQLSMETEERGSVTHNLTTLSCFFFSFVFLASAFTTSMFTMSLWSWPDPACQSSVCGAQRQFIANRAWVNNVFYLLVSERGLKAKRRTYSKKKRDQRSRSKRVKRVYKKIKENPIFYQETTGSFVFNYRRRRQVFRYVCGNSVQLHFTHTYKSMYVCKLIHEKWISEQFVQANSCMYIYGGSVCVYKV